LVILIIDIKYKYYITMQEIKLKIKKEAEELKKEFIERSVSWIMAGFGLVAALAWNEAIKSLVDLLLGPTKASIFAKFLYAIIVTILVVVVSRRLDNLAKDKVNITKEN